MSTDLDEIDQQIIHELYGNGRLSVRALAERLNLSRAATHSRVDALLQGGVITGFRAVVDYEKIGRGTAAYINMRIEQSESDQVFRSLHAVPAVRSVAFVTGEYDIVALVFARDTADLRRIVMEELQTVSGIRSTHTTLLFGFETSEVW